MTENEGPHADKMVPRVSDLRKSPQERFVDAGKELVKQFPFVAVVLSLFSRELSSHRVEEFLEYVQRSLDALPHDVHRQVSKWMTTQQGRETIEMVVRANDEEVIEEKRRYFANLLVNAGINGGEAPLYEISLLRGLTRQHLALLAVAEEQRQLGVIPGGNPDGEEYPNHHELVEQCRAAAERHGLTEMPFIESAFYDLVGKQLFEVSITMDGFRPRPRYEQLAHHLQPAGVRLLDLLKEPQPE